MRNSRPTPRFIAGFFYRSSDRAYACPQRFSRIMALSLDLEIDMLPSPNDTEDVTLEALDFASLAAATLTDRGEIWLLRWLNNLEKSMERVDEGTLKSRQAQIEADLLQIVTKPAPTSQPAPVPGRPIRHLVARIFVKLFNRAEQRSLFDVIGSLLKVAGTEPIKNASDNKAFRIASFCVAGDIIKVHGPQVMSQFAESVMIAIRVIKSTNNAPILRSQALFCLNSSLIIGSKSLSPSDNLSKEVLKTLRYALADKTFSIIRASVECLLTLLDQSSNLISSLNDIEAFLAICFKGLELVDFVTRRSLSKLIASLLASTQVFGSAIINAQPNSKIKRKNESQEDDEEDPYPTTMTAEEKGKTLLTPEEMLLLLSTPYCKSGSSRQVKNGLIDAYATLLTLLGSGWVEQFYPEILRHIILNVGCGKSTQNAALSVARHDVLVSRKLASILLRDVISARLLSEQGQVVAIQEVSSSIINKWPALMPTHQPPNKIALLIAINEVDFLLKQVGSVTQPIQEVLYNPLIRLLGHPSYSVQMSAALCLRTYCSLAPGKLTSTINNVLDLLHKDLSHLGHPGGPSDVNKRAVGHAHGLAGLVSLIPLRPLYVSFDVSAKIMSLAIQLLKESGAHELHISVVEIQVSWILVSALTALGPNFVRLHLPQLLLLWKNALPKPSAKDPSNNQFRTDAEWCFLLHLREYTLSAILCFLKHDSQKLVTLDIAHRIVTMLNNALSFLSDFEKRYHQLDQESIVFAGSKLSCAHRELLLRRRLFQCCIALNEISVGSLESLQLPLLELSLALIADPEKYTGSSVQAAISAGTGSFTSVWDSVDGFGFGVTSLLKENVCLGNNEENSIDVANGTSDNLMTDWLNRDLTEVAVASVLQQPCIESNEHDFLIICTPQTLDRPARVIGSHTGLPAPPVSTSMIDAALELFALYLPLVPSTQQHAFLDRLYKFNHSSKVEKNPGRKMAILVNSVTALLLSTRLCMSSTFAAKSKQLDVTVVNLMKDVLIEGLVHPDFRLRSASAEAFGRVCALGSNSFMLSQVQHCVTQIVNNTDPDSRSGYALALSQVYTQVGSLSGGAALKTIVDVLMSLSADPHPSVHFWALRALSDVIHTAGLSYTPFLNSTLGMVVRLYCSDSHEIESGSIGYVNLRANLPCYQNFCKILNAIIGVLGPELCSSSQSQLLIQFLNEELNEEADEGIKVEALKAIQHFIMFSIESINMSKLIVTLRKHLSSNRRTLKVASVNSIYQLVQKNAILMSKLGGDQLVVNLFSILDDDPTIAGVRDSIKSWLRQTADSNPSAWIDLCMRIVSRTTAAQTKTVEESGQATIFIDEESQGLDHEQNAGAHGNQKNRNTSRWRTQLFALQCLHEVFLTVIRNKRGEHFNVQIAQSKGFSNVRLLMFSRVSDLIKMAFTASTANIMEIRLEGLNVLRDVIENFKRSCDLDFDESPLLEQHQAPITAALTPAFSHDSFPEVLASAIQVCAVFVGSGVVKQINKMGRILKLLTSALESCRDSEIVSLGEMKDFSTSASIMIKTAIYAAWAEFQVISIHQAYLNDVITPHLALLCPFWVASLREYARLKSDEDPSSHSVTSLLGVGSMQSGLHREVSLPYYENAWPKMMRAIASLIKAKNFIMLQALDGVDISNSKKLTNQPQMSVTTTRSEPVLYFHVLLGLVYEAATVTASIGTDDPSSLAAETMETALFSLEALLQTEVVGSEGLKKESAIFGEICNLCYRLSATEAARVQVFVVRCIVQLALSCIGPTSVEPGSQAELQLYQCLRVIVQVLKNAVPGMSSMAASKARKSPAHHAGLLIAAFTACADLADRGIPSSREQIYGVVLALYAETLKEESSGVDLVGPTLSTLKNLVERAYAHSKFSDCQTSVLADVLHGFISQILLNLQDGTQRLGKNRALLSIKLRNNLLSYVLLVTSLPPDIPISRSALEQYCTFLSALLLTEDFELGATAIQCAKSLILTKRRGSPLFQVSLTQLLPGLIELVARTTRLSETDAVRTGIVTETLRIFGGVVGSVSAEQRPQALAIFLPVYLLLLDSSSPLKPIATSQVLQLASIDSNAFKEAMNSLESEQRNRLESALRGSIQQRPSGAITFSQANGPPSIELKSFG
ncbi:hypothetical protein O181_019160 [Austropuccinia psidii MF-1]|uniref:LAA1-like C-terminal TPR repeats domain-containing protein n=1 Tax=Austropuccinia psidii MF-1 TaxID=1389203 RepID=A0A9Q3CB92_9BASI|nr:hypothetical protein [Austropuccinia psidii MF-1]